VEGGAHVRVVFGVGDGQARRSGLGSEVGAGDPESLEGGGQELLAFGVVHAEPGIAVDGQEFDHADAVYGHLEQDFARHVGPAEAVLGDDQAAAGNLGEDVGKAVQAVVRGVRHRRGGGDDLVAVFVEGVGQLEFVQAAGVELGHDLQAVVEEHGRQK
jgi:hypothetical protein